MESRKRKRESETGAPRIKYHVEQLGRSFERILKEDSNEELRSIVRKKLKLDDTTTLELVQLREGKFYDLEDDDDFEAFKAAAFAFSSLDVRVSFSPQAVASTAEQTHVPPPTETSTNHGSPGKAKTDSQTKPKSRISVSEKATQDANTNQIPSADPIQDGENVLAEEDVPAPPKKRQKRDDTDTTSKTKKKTSKSKAPDIEPPNQEQKQEPPKKRQRKSKGTEVNVAVQNVPSSAVPETVPPNQEQVQEPPKKRARKSKETEVLRDVSTSAVPEAVPKSKKSIQKKASKTEIGNIRDPPQDVLEPKRAEQKDGQSLDLEAPASRASLSAPAPAAPSHHVSAPDRDSDALSRPSTVISDFSKKSAEKLLERFKSQKMLSAKANGNDSVTSEKAKGKEKSQTKARAGTSRLRQSWVPEDGTDVSSISSSEKSPLSSSTSAPHPPTASPTPAPPVLPLVSTVVPTPPVIPSGHTKPLSKPKSSSKQVSVSSCPVCLSRPLHLRHLCPIIKGGSSVIHERIKELEKEGARDDLVQELHEWLDKEKRKEKVARKGRTEDDTVSTVVDSLVSKNALSHAPKTNRKRDSHVSVPEWAPMMPQDGRVSEVTVESRNEGSEDEESSTSGSGPSPENGKIDDKKLGQVDLESESESESDLAEPVSGSSSESIAGQRTKTPHVDLEDVDLEALIRGPVVKVQLSRLAEESDTDSAEEMESLLEEDEEERPQRAERKKSERFSSAEAASNDEIQESEAETVAELEPEKSVTADETNISTGLAHQGSAGTMGGSASVEANFALNNKSELQRTSQTEPSPVSQEAEEMMAGLNIRPSERPNARTSEPSDLAQVILPPTTPARQPTSSTSGVRSPLLGQMKDLSGTISSNPPDNEIGTAPPIPPTMNDTLAPALGEEAEQRERGPSDPPPQAVSTTRSKPLVTPDSTSVPTAEDPAPKPRKRPVVLSAAAKMELKVIDDAKKAQRKVIKAEQAELKRIAAVEKAQRKAIMEEQAELKRIADAEKAELKAIKDAEKAARVAEKLAEKLEKPEKKQSKKAPARPSSLRKPSGPVAAASESAANQPPTSTLTPVASQWETLPPPDSSVVSQSSSPAVDQLTYSSPTVRLNKGLNGLEKVVKLGGSNGITSPKAISVATSASRGRDEDVVEEIIGSQKESHKQKTLPTEHQRLFLPGASQMTQTQFTQTPDVPDDQSASSTSSDTEADEREGQKDPKPSTASRLSFAAKTAFPSLSQLSFDKFRPTFLLPGGSSSQDKTTNPAVQADDESESDDEDSSDENHSHIPKGRVAGAGLTKRKSRGLLHG